QRAVDVGDAGPRLAVPGPARSEIARADGPCAHGGPRPEALVAPGGRDEQPVRAAREAGRGHVEARRYRPSDQVPAEGAADPRGPGLAGEAFQVPARTGSRRCVGALEIMTRGFGDLRDRRGVSAQAAHEAPDACLVPPSAKAMLALRAGEQGVAGGLIDQRR